MCRIAPSVVVGALLSFGSRYLPSFLLIDHTEIVRAKIKAEVASETGPFIVARNETTPTNVG